jgi:RNA polymerase sigma-70 factor (ECF subfamily)
MEADRDAVREPEAFLRRVVMRLCLDQLKSARHRRETYVGPWLPEPVAEPTPDDLDDSTLPLMMALERLSPLERAAFLLHDVFDVSFEEVAETRPRTGGVPAACRPCTGASQGGAAPLSRAQGTGLEVATAFFAATRNGDMERLRSLLATDVIAYSDGGGRKLASTEPIGGIDEVMRVHTSLARLFADSMSRMVRYAFINGLPGFVTIERDDTLQTTALELDQHGRIAAIYVTRNPEKLRHLGAEAVQ